MREIKFRGKRVDNGEWVYGSYLNFDYHNSVDYVEGHTIVMSNGHEFEVDPETVGQFIGKKDGEGKMIFEGDIYQDLDSPPGWMSMPLIIWYNEENAQFKAAGLKNPFDYIFDVFGMWEPHGRIISNIHDNPSLLGL